ncbi:MAG: DUF2007 domain-containing protein [Armatimonadota bacterium]|nr:DUF2007 domain-containing protein [Armatimonadota bacterium]
MKKLLSSINIAEVGLLKTLLEAEGIACATRNEHLSIASGSVPFVECYPELWVLNDEDLATAQELLARWQNPASEQLASWVCPRCGEENEGQFAACWQCGTMIDEPVQQ